MKKKIEPSQIANLLRKYLSIPKEDDFDKKIISFTKLSFTNNLFSKKIINKINAPVTPDHVIRIKSKPLFLDFSNIKNKSIENFINKEITKYKNKYIKYFKNYKHINKNAIMHDPSPRLILVKGMGLFSSGKKPSIGLIKYRNISSIILLLIIFLLYKLQINNIIPFFCFL